jgi:hypothetical protein
MDTALQVILAIVVIGTIGYLMYRLKFFDVMSEFVDSMAKFLAALFLLRIGVSIIEQITKNVKESPTGFSQSKANNQLIEQGIKAFSSGNDQDRKNFANDVVRTFVGGYSDVPLAYRNLESESNDWVREEYEQNVSLLNSLCQRPPQQRDGMQIQQINRNVIMLASELERRGIWVDPFSALHDPYF